MTSKRVNKRSPYDSHVSNHVDDSLLCSEYSYKEDSAPRNQYSEYNYEDANSFIEERISAFEQNDSESHSDVDSQESYCSDEWSLQEKINLRDNRAYYNIEPCSSNGVDSKIDEQEEHHRLVSEYRELCRNHSSKIQKKLTITCPTHIQYYQRDKTKPASYKGLYTHKSIGSNNILSETQWKSPATLSEKFVVNTRDKIYKYRKDRYGSRYIPELMDLGEKIVEEGKESKEKIFGRVFISRWEQLPANPLEGFQAVEEESVEELANNKIINEFTCDVCQKNFFSESEQKRHNEETITLLTSEEQEIEEEIEEYNDESIVSTVLLLPTTVSLQHLYCPYREAKKLQNSSVVDECANDSANSIQCKFYCKRSKEDREELIVLKNSQLNSNLFDIYRRILSLKGSSDNEIVKIVFTVMDDNRNSIPSSYIKLTPNFWLSNKDYHVLSVSAEAIDKAITAIPSTTDVKNNTDWKLSMHLHYLHSESNDKIASYKKGVSYVEKRKINYPTSSNVLKTMESLFYRASRGEVLPLERRRWLNNNSRKLFTQDGPDESSEAVGDNSILKEIKTGLSVSRGPCSAAVAIAEGIHHKAANIQSEKPTKLESALCNSKQGRNLAAAANSAVSNTRIYVTRNDNTPISLLQCAELSKNAKLDKKHIITSECETSDCNKDFKDKDEAKKSSSNLINYRNQKLTKREKVLLIRQQYASAVGRSSENNALAEDDDTDKKVPPFYVCNRCGAKGEHFIQLCPTRDDHNFDNIMQVARAEKKRQLELAEKTEENSVGEKRERAEGAGSDSEEEPVERDARKQPCSDLSVPAIPLELLAICEDIEPLKASIKTQIGPEGELGNSLHQSMKAVMKGNLKEDIKNDQDEFNKSSKILRPAKRSRPDVVARLPNLYEQLCAEKKNNKYSIILQAIRHFMSR